MKNIPSNIKYKKCSKCKNTFELNDINFQKRSKGSVDGYRNQCKSCRQENCRKNDKKYRKSGKRLEYLKRYWLKNKDKIRAHGIAYEKTYKERRKELRIKNRDKISARGKKFYLEHKKEINKHHKLYANAHKEKIRLRTKQYNLEHKEEINRKNRLGYRNNLQDRKQHRLKFRYNITLEQKEQMLVNQNYRCKCCGCDLGLLNEKGINIDHDHGTGKIRGILCGSCNRALGFMEENIDKIQGLINYAIYCRTENFTDFPVYLRDTRKKYKIEMMIKQKYRCPSCNTDLKQLDVSKIDTDHDHSTQKIRGALC